MSATRWSAERRRTAALLSLFACPGAGQFLLGRRRLGLALAVPAVGLSVALLALFAAGLWQGVVEAGDATPDLMALLWSVLTRRPLAFAGGAAALVALSVCSAVQAYQDDGGEKS